MANIMTLKSLRNKPSRNGFDLSSKRNFTAKSGELLPVRCWEVLPGDSWSIDLKSFTRTQPLNTAAFARMREYYDFYFVPYDLLWNKANTVLTQMYDNVQHATSLDPVRNVLLKGDMPYTTCESISKYLNSLAKDVTPSSSSQNLNYFGYNRALGSAKLLEYLGYGNFYKYAYSKDTTWKTNPLVSNLELNLYGALAYQKIYADHIRDSQWERVSPSTFNVDYLDGSNMFVDVSSDTSFINNYSFFDLRYCNWQKDMFHGVVPRAQYGDVAAVPVESLPVVGEQPESAISILVLRQMEFLQRWKEITQSGNKDYKEQIEKHWNVSPGDGLSEMSTYLGGISLSLDINEVVNNNITGDNSADIAGKGTGVGNGRISFNSQGRYGLIMCIYYCLLLIVYTTDLVSPVFTRINSADYAIPEFDRVGMESVRLINLMNPSKPSTHGSLDAVFLGYAPRYIDYKTDIDSSVGAFKTSLRNWIISYDNDSVLHHFLNSVSYDPEVPAPTPPLNIAPVDYTFFKVNPNCVNPLFAVAVDDTIETDNFLCTTFFDVKVVRNLDVDGLPY